MPGVLTEWGRISASDPRPKPLCPRQKLRKKEKVADATWLKEITDRIPSNGIYTSHPRY